MKKLTFSGFIICSDLVILLCGVFLKCKGSDIYSSLTMKMFLLNPKSFNTVVLSKPH